MSQQLQVGPNPLGILWGRQPACTLANLGNVTVYLGDDSTVTAGVDYPLLPGASIEYDEGSSVYAVTDVNAVEAGRLQAVFESSNRWEEPNTGTRLLYNGSADSNGSGFITFNGKGNQVFGSVTVDVYALSAGNTSTFNLNQGLISLIWTENQPGLLTDAISTSGGITQLHQASFNLKPYSATATVNAGSVIASATFPNISGAGGLWGIGYSGFAGAGVPTAGKLGVRVYATAATVQATTITPTSTSNYYTAVGSSASTWTSLIGNTFATGALSQAASTVTRYYFPPMSGPVRITVSATQTGAGTVTGIPFVTTAWIVSETVQQYDTALFTSTAAGSIFAAATYAVWPTQPTSLQITTPAGVTLSNIVLTATSGVI